MGLCAMAQAAACSCESATAVVSNCVLSGNLLALAAGRTGCTLNNCILSENTAFGFGGGALVWHAEQLHADAATRLTLSTILLGGGGL